MKKIEARLLKGFRDYMPGEMMLRQKVINKIKTVFELHGFVPLETPTLEHYDILAGKYGEEGDRLIYKFQDHGGRDIAMRYDLTVPLARVVGQYGELPKPFKRYQIQPVWRADKPQKGRFREFYQCDVDIVGSNDMSADTEILSVVYHSLQALGFHKFTIKVNHRLILNALLKYAGLGDDALLPLCRSIDKLAKIGNEGVRDEMRSSGFSEDATDKVMKSIDTVAGDTEGLPLDKVEELFVSIEDGKRAVADLRKIFSYLNAMGIDESYYRFDLSLARGLDYYTGPVFETVVSEPKVGSITGGGRYDELIGMFSSQSVPAVGTSLGLERIITVIQELSMMETPTTPTQVLVINFSEAASVESMKIAGIMREAGIPTEVYLNPVKVGKQLRYADRIGIPMAVIPGEEELSKNEVVVKQLKNGAQESVAIEELVDYVKSLLGLGS